MKLRFIVIVLTAFSNAHAQTIEQFFDYNWKPCEAIEARFYTTITKTDSGYARNDYFIHEKTLQMNGKYNDIDCKIANGHFRYFHSNGILESGGMYINGQKNGLWLGNHSNGMMSDSTVYRSGKIIGTSLSWHSNGYLSDSTFLTEDGSGVEVSWFENGAPSSAGLYSTGQKQDGRWKYFHNNGTISSVETYKDGNLISKEYYDEEGKAQGDTTSRDIEAMFPGGTSAWQRYIMKKIYFPEQYKIVNADKAVVVVTFAINEDGKVANVFVSTPFYREFDQIAESAISHSPVWKPAIRHNRKVKSWVRQPVSFSQEGR